MNLVILVLETSAAGHDSHEFVLQLVKSYGTSILITPKFQFLDYGLFHVVGKVRCMHIKSGERNKITNKAALLLIQ